MKTKLSLSTMIIFALAIKPLAAESLPESGHIALSIVIDSAWSNEHQVGNYRSLARQGIASLRPGDYVEIITGHPGKPKLRAAQFIKSGDAQEIKNLTSLLNGIKCPIFSDVNIYKSVEMALNRLIKSSAKNSFDHVVMIVFTDGKLNDKDVGRLLELSKEFTKRDWFYITGTYQTNKKLLVAANQGILNFSLISEANPAWWIKSTRDVKITESEPKEIPVLDDSVPAKDSGKTAYSVTIDSTVSFSEGSEQTIETPPAVIPEELQQEVEELEEPTTPLIEEEMQEEPPEEIPEEEATVKPIPHKKPRKIPKILIWLVPAICLFILVAVLLFSSISKANKWQTGVNSRLKTNQHKEPGTLVAKLNGQPHTLGREDRIGTINIGSGPNNTIRIPDKSISDRHVKIFRNRNGLMLQNIGKTPITVNSSTVKPNAKQRLIIPSVIEFNNKIRLNISVVRPKPITDTNNKDSKNETVNQNTR